MARVMIVDDSSFMRSSLKYIIESAGHEVVGMATNGKEAVGMHKTVKPDLVTMDILMAEMDGLTAAAQIIKADGKAKIIMVTAIGQDEKQEQARSIGVSGYIRKPFKKEDIITEFEKVLKRAAA
jgi:two-component system, chemotaxis family, chemotaxis protein CheY